MPYTIVPERRGLGLQSSGGVERGGGGVSGAAKHSDRSIVHWQKKQQRHQVSPVRRTAAAALCASKTDFSSKNSNETLNDTSYSEI